MIIQFTANSDQNSDNIVATRGDTRTRLFVSTALSSSPTFGTVAKALHANATLMTRHLLARAENLSDAGFDKEAPDIVRNSLSPEMRDLRRTALSRRDELDGQWNDWRRRASRLLRFKLEMEPNSHPGLPAQLVLRTVVKRHVSASPG